MKEVDARFELGKHHLAGAAGISKLKPKMDLNAVEAQRDDVLSNIPAGLSISRLVYPMSKTQMSTVLLVGVKRRTMIHASYIYDFLDEMKPDLVFI